jgi:glycosyltransferase involved in cell wall biosynthesis
LVTVLQVIPALNAGGAERTTVEMAEAIAAAGWRALVASSGGQLEGALAAAGGELIRMDLAAKNPLKLATNAAKLHGLIASRGVDLVHARSRAPAWSALIAARRAGAAFITTYHGAYGGRTAMKRFYNGVMARGDIVIANSAYMQRRIAEAHNVYPARIRVIPRGVDMTRFDPAIVTPDRIMAQRRAFGVEDNDPRPIVLLPARLTFWKGHDVAMQALASLPDLQALMVFAGDGDKAEAMWARAGLLGVADRIRIPGYVADMQAAYACSTLVIAPSTLPEAFGRTAAEAQAMQVPVIATAHGGALEVVDDGVTGFLIPPNDAQALADAIGRVFAMGPDERARMGNAGRARIASLYTAQALQDATMRVYRQALGLE